MQIEKWASARAMVVWAASLCGAVSIFASTAQGQISFREPAVGGISIDTDGVVHQPTLEHIQLAHQRMLAEIAGPSQQLQAPARLRMISLRRLESAVAAQSEEGVSSLPEEIRFLAGIQRIQYVFVYPQQRDIVLAGPGEGWRVDDQGRVVGVTTGRPVLLLDDLLVALRSASSLREGGITCSIDPSPEGLRALQQLLKRQDEFRPQVVSAMENALGPQSVTVTGVPADSHFARVLVACDYRMKRIAMNLSPSPVTSLPGFLDLVSARRANVKTMTPRWWLACHYEPLAQSPDGLAWELRGPGVKTMAEDDYLRQDGSLRRSGAASPLVQEWADLMTANYEALSAADTVFGELRNLMDLCVVASLIEHQQLLSKAHCQLPLLADASSDLRTVALQPARAVPTLCSFTKVRSRYVITASGGVHIHSWPLIESAVEDPQVQQTRQQASPPAVAEQWWWN